MRDECLPKLLRTEARLIDKCMQYEDNLGEHDEWSSKLPQTMW